jgi:hypothetical protein
VHSSIVVVLSTYVLLYLLSHVRRTVAIVPHIALFKGER